MPEKYWRQQRSSLLPTLLRLHPHTIDCPSLGRGGLGGLRSSPYMQPLASLFSLQSLSSLAMEEVSLDPLALAMLELQGQERIELGYKQGIHKGGTWGHLVVPARSLRL